MCTYIGTGAHTHTSTKWKFKNEIKKQRKCGFLLSSKKFHCWPCLQWHLSRERRWQTGLDGPEEQCQSPLEMQWQLVKGINSSAWGKYFKANEFEDLDRTARPTAFLRGVRPKVMTASTYFPWDITLSATCLYSMLSNVKHGVKIAKYSLNKSA